MNPSFFTRFEELYFSKKIKIIIFFDIIKIIISIKKFIISIMQLDCGVVDDKMHAQRNAAHPMAPNNNCLK